MGSRLWALGHGPSADRLYIWAIGHGVWAIGYGLQAQLASQLERQESDWTARLASAAQHAHSFVDEVRQFGLWCTAMQCPRRLLSTFGRWQVASLKAAASDAKERARQAEAEVARLQQGDGDSETQAKQAQLV